MTESLEGDRWQHHLSLFDDVLYPESLKNFRSVNPNAPKGGHLRLGIHGTFDSLNPYIAKGTPPSKAPWVYRYGFLELNEPLMAGAGAYAPSPDELDTSYGLIAEAVKLNSDRSELEFRLRKDAHFHDGHPITGNDVLFSVNTLSGNPTGKYSAIIDQVERVEVINPHHVRFKLKPSSSKGLPLTIASLPVLPEHYWRDRDFNKTTLEPPLLSGPYKIVKVNPGQRIEMERVKDYWGRYLPINRGRYNFDKISLIFFRDNTTAFEAFKAGNTDIFMEGQSKNWATGYQHPAIENGLIIKEEIPNNMPVRQLFYVFNHRKNHLQDRRVREAIGILFDWEWTSRIIFHNAYVRTTSYFPNNSQADRSLPSPEELKLLSPYRNQLPNSIFTKPFQLSKTSGDGNIHQQQRQALQLLKEAGWLLQNGHLNHKNHGQFPKLEFIHYSSMTERVVLPYVHNLKALGINLEFKQLDINQYYQRLQNHDFDLTLYAYPIQNFPGEELKHFFHSQRAELEDGRNLMGLQLPVVDQLLGQVIQAQTREQLQTVLSALDRVLLWEHVAIPGWYGNKHRVAYWQHLKHQDPHPKYNFRVSDWWMEQK